MKDSLLNLQKGIGLRDYSSETEEKGTAITDKKQSPWPRGERRAI
uniref:Uncharacterized protein n=1 Tax=Anguilla anguilla TaxID=7936 RepID=A0A0E9U3U5_ANGAN